jgi:hypothetical protein
LEVPRGLQWLLPDVQGCGIEPHRVDLTSGLVSWLDFSILISACLTVYDFPFGTEAIDRPGIAPVQAK